MFIKFLPQKSLNQKKENIKKQTNKPPNPPKTPKPYKKKTPKNQKNHHEKQSNAKPKPMKYLMILFISKMQLVPVSE